MRYRLFSLGLLIDKSIQQNDDRGQDPCLEACKDSANIGQCLKSECPPGFQDVSTEPLGNCLTPNEDPGCENAACEATVCAIDSYCCSDVWDGVCTGEAAMLCESPLLGNCLTSNDNPGCEDAACEATVCAVDSFCCDSQWDGICKSVALNLCVN
jgi:hypothetical protein